MPKLQGVNISILPQLSLGVKAFKGARAII